MPDVIDFTRAKLEREETYSGTAVCTECSHQWDAKDVPRTLTQLMECPSCHRNFGAFKAPLMPTTMWECNCGSNLFYLSTNNTTICRSCMNESDDWLYSCED